MRLGETGNWESGRGSRRDRSHKINLPRLAPWGFVPDLVYSNSDRSSNPAPPEPTITRHNPPWKNIAIPSTPSTVIHGISQ